MPELPEVETIRLGLERHVLGRRLEEVTVHSARAVRKLPDAATLEDDFAGRVVEEVARRGKFLWFVLGGAPTALVVHLGMSGQLLLHDRAPADLPRHTAVTVVLDGGVILFVDQRTFGYVHSSPFVTTDDGQPAGAGTQLPTLPALASHIARDPLDPHLDLPAVVARMGRTSSAIKRVLLDQRHVSGIGNIYADETLWHARIHPATPANHLPPEDLERLVRTAAEVMGAAVRLGGTSFDALYVGTRGESGYFARELRAYGRSSMPCARCSTPLVREVLGGRSTHLCPRCQISERRAQWIGSAP
ncbi:MAG: bifunctional DNA-formamidopyrimidine glycosylase/DNA-(apurinic or apyrimidinic site) lyase [Actinomycetota bacterium]